MLKLNKVEQLMAEKGISKMTLRHQYSINLNQLNKYLKDGIQGGLIDNLCRALECQPGDILEYTTDNTSDDTQTV